MDIDADFPGGNIIVDSVEADLVRLRQDLRDTEGWWFHWAFRVRGAAGRHLTFRFAGRRPIGPLGPSCSLDTGATWRWLGADAVRQTEELTEFDFAFPATDTEARFCFAIPYVGHDLQRFCAAHPDIAVSTLCTSRKGRPVELLTASAAPESADYRLFLTARHHACESVASYVLEGLLGAATAADNELGKWFRRHVAVAAVPSVDKDGVEDGDQGKNRRPRDHNRDYDGTSIYPETAAIRAFLPRWTGGSPTVAVDLHCPYIDGRDSTRIHLVGSCYPRIAAEQQRFAVILEAMNNSPLPFHAPDYLPFGTSWNNRANFSAGKTCARWASEQAGVTLAGTIEVPYALVHDRPLTVDSARGFGRALADALRCYWAG